MTDTQIALFRNKGIRKTMYKGDWYFVIVDIISALTDSIQPSGYIKDMRRRDPELSKGWGQIATPLLINTVGGKQKMNCASTENILRIIQSVPSPKAEPMKRWLAKTGFERIQEIEDPELATKRTRYLYKAKGYPDSWIEKRMRGIVIREELTNEWKNRGIEKDLDYKILTAEISKATFDVTPFQYKKLKGLRRQNLRDHMDDFELIFTMLGERSTTEIHKVENSRGFTKLKKDAEEGGEIAGVARRKLEKRIKRSIVSGKNFLSDKIK